MKQVLKAQTVLSTDAGRSMVEMLGTLAIMGVLSIGGIAGYRYAMDKYRVNETMDELNRRAIMYAIQLEQGVPASGTVLSNGEFGPKTTLGYGVEGYVSSDTGYFEIALKEVPSSVCRGLVRDYTSPVLIDVNGTEYETPSDEWEACGEDVLSEMAFVYTQDLDASGDVPERGQDDPFSTPCEEGFYHDMNTGECVEDTVCTNKDQFFVGTQCYDCPTEDNPVVGKDISDFGWNVTNCGKCSHNVVSSYWACGYVCLYCPAPRVACQAVCCAEGQVCRGTGRETAECVTPACTSNSDCTDASTPLCDTVTGECFAGCRTNADCPDSNTFCDLDINSTWGSCTQEPGRGTCRSISKQTVGSYVGSTDRMNWWSARNFCDRLGKSMIDISGKCSNWADIKASGYGDCTEMQISGASSSHYWTKTLWSPCRAFSVVPGNGNVSNGNPNNGIPALCEERG